ncbi:MAG: hypothetical protein BroJett021_03310 [Chloroflexota bacterium]|nr:MAG: hypothetical protein BroJett021_03310 [Chloroflexota bacterium]
MATRNVGLMGQYAGIVTRGIALLIDILIVVLLLVIINVSIRMPLDFFLDVNPESCAAFVSGAATDRLFDNTLGLLCRIVDIVLVVAAFVVGPIYFIFLATSGGQTVGKYIMGVRIVRLDGKPMGYPQATIRWFGYLASLLPLGLGFLWAIVDDRRRTFHDRLAGTCVIYAWRAQQNDYLLERIHNFFGRVSSSRNYRSLLSAIIDRPTELVTLAVSNYDDLRTMMRIAKNGLVDGEYDILGLQEYVKSEDGVLTLLGSDMHIDVGVKAVELSATLGLPAAEIEQIKADIPNDHFVVVALVNERDADKLMKVIARRTSAQIRRYPLKADVATVTKAIESSDEDDLSVIALRDVAPAAALDNGQRAVQNSEATLAMQSAAGPTMMSTELAATVESLKREQAALRVELERKNKMLLALEQQVRSAEVMLASTRAAVDADRAMLEQLRTEYAAMPSGQRASALAMPSDTAASVLPASKQAAIDAAIDLRILPQEIEAPQDLTAIKGIGPTFEQRLYAAGVGSYWEVAALSDDNLRSILALNDLQAKSVDPAAIRADARRLAEETDSIGFIWQGQPPDDFELIEGIGPVFEQRLYAAGIHTFTALAQATPEQLAQIVAAPKPSQPDYTNWIAQAQRLSKSPE